MNQYSHSLTLVCLWKSSRCWPHTAGNHRLLTIFSDPHAHISGHRILAFWVAGQLLDSAIMRLFAALDRISILLAARAGILPKTKKQDAEVMPSFRGPSLNALDQFYSASKAWSVLKALTRNPIFVFAKQWRDNFVHRRRLLSQLGGSTTLIQYDQSGNAVAGRGIDAGDHLALVLACYNELLKPAVSLLGDLLQECDRQV
jgi:hypothetical protein